MNQESNPTRDDKYVAQLLQLAGPREDPPNERAERVLTNVKAHWQRRVPHGRQPAKSAVLWLSGLAAALVLAVGVLRPWSTGLEAIDQTARIAAITGDVRVVEANGGDTAALAATLVPGDRVLTGDDGLVSLAVASGHELRLASNTSMTLIGADRIELASGAVYVDSHATQAGASLNVVTPYGIARDVGTRFEVRLLNNGLEVAVRDGEVRLTDDAADWTAMAGQGLRRQIRTTGVELFDVSDSDERWNWTRDLAFFELDGAQAIEYLEWLCREQGWTLNFSDAQARARAGEISHGDVSGSTPLESLEMVLPVHALDFRLEDDGELIISVAD